MTDFLFTYRGRDLAPLLTELLVNHEIALVEIDAKLDAYTPGLRERAKRMNPMQVKPPTDEMEVRGVQLERDTRHAQLREVELWLLECHRTPKASWQLRLADLDRLYPEQKAREILASFRAPSRGSSGPFARLLAALGVLRVQPRQRHPSGALPEAAQTG